MYKQFHNLLQGGIELENSGTVMLGSGFTQPYDSHIVQWIVPQLEYLNNPGTFKDVAQIHAYR